MSKLLDELRRKFKTPQEAIAAMGLDAALLEEGGMTNGLKLRGAASRVALMTYLRPKLAAGIRPETIDLRMAMDAMHVRDARDRRGKVMDAVRDAVKDRMSKDADLSDLSDLLEMLEHEEAEEPGGTDDPNGGVPAAMEFLKGRLPGEDLAMIRDILGHDEESEEERRRHAEEEAAEDRRHAEDRKKHAEDNRAHLGRDETMEECDRRERALDARHRMGRDETPEEKERREGEDARARDRRAADAKRRMGRDESPEERREREAADRALDRKAGMDRRRAEDRKKHAEDRRKAAMDKMRAAKDRRAHDNPPPFSGMPEPGGEMVSKSAMDAAIRSAVDTALTGDRARQQALARAREDVRPWVGAIDMALDSADAIYRAALVGLGVQNIEQIHPSAYRTILEMQPRPGAAPVQRHAGMALDSAAAGGFAQRYPNAARVENV